MKNKDLQEFLKQHPDDMEVVMMPDEWTYETTFDFEVTDVLLNSVPDDEFRIYYQKIMTVIGVFNILPLKYC
jgi:hypothetical protein